MMELAKLIIIVYIYSARGKNNYRLY